MRGTLSLAALCGLLCLGAGSTPARAAEPIAPRFDDVDVNVNASQDAETIYRANAYQIIHVGSEDGSWWRPTRGKLRLSIDHDAFFESLGRHDLASQFASRHALGRTLELGGFASACAGVIVTPVSIYKGSAIGALVGVGMMLGGVITRGIGKDMQAPTFPEDQAIDMAARYNEALRARLGVKAGVEISGRF